MSFPQTAPRGESPVFLARFFVHCWILAVLCVLQLAASAQELVTNAESSEVAAVKNLVARLENAARNRDVVALGFFGATLPVDGAPIETQTRISHIASAPRGALVRLGFSVSVQRAMPVVLNRGTQDFWISRVATGGFALTDRRFFSAPDAVEALAQAAEIELRDSALDNKSATLDLVASRIGGRWIALRRQRWDGELVASTLESRSSAPREFLKSQILTAPPEGAVTGHFLLQKGERGWFGVGASFEPSRRIARGTDDAAASLRARVEGEGFLRAETHRDFGFALASIGLYNEAADALEKAELLREGLIGSQKLREANANRALDPQELVARQIQAEASVGLGPEHPTYLISALLREQRTQPSVIGALRLALEYSRVAEEELAQAKVREATEIKNRSGVRPQDAAWVQLLFDHLRERATLARTKPSNVLRSELFTVRVWPGDRGAIDLLAALEESQHTVYADFGIPMGNTEVLLWRSQDEFARYTTQFTQQGGSEFVAALTLTKLVSTRTGPLVLGEEINAYANEHDIAALYSTLAHEYGHVAVRQISRGRLVPIWFNEGIASSVEGGYDGYVQRVRRAANNGTLLSMRELQAWNVDGERAFLAYSQANSMMDFIVAKWGKKAVLDILRQIGRDANADEAFRNVLGLTQTELFNRWVREGIK